MEIASAVIRFAFTKRFYHDDGIDESVGLIRCNDSATMTAAEDTGRIGPVLLGNHPNPFNPQTTIMFSLDQPQRAEVSVYDLTGRLLGVLADRSYDAGSHSVIWNGEDALGRAVPSGTYVVQFATETITQARKVMLLR